MVATVLALGWLGLWLLYLNYTWAVSMVAGHGGPGGGGGVTVHVIRFYIPVLGLIALLGTWLLVRLRDWMSWTALVALSLAGVLSISDVGRAALRADHELRFAQRAVVKAILTGTMSPKTTSIKLTSKLRTANSELQRSTHTR